MMALLCGLLAHLAWVAPRIHKVGWVGSLPTTILVAVFPWRTTLGVPYQRDTENALALELARRLRFESTWRWQRAWLARRCVKPLLRNGDTEAYYDAGWSPRRMLDDLGPDAHAALPVLVDRIEDGSAYERGCAVGWLHYFKLHDESVAHAAASVLGEPNWNIRVNAYSLLLELSKSDDDDVRRIAQEALADAPYPPPY